MYLFCLNENHCGKKKKEIKINKFIKKKKIVIIKNNIAIRIAGKVSRYIDASMNRATPNIGPIQPFDTLEGLVEDTHLETILFVSTETLDLCFYFSGLFVLGIYYYLSYDLRDCYMPVPLSVYSDAKKMPSNLPLLINNFIYCDWHI